MEGGVEKGWRVFEEKHSPHSRFASLQCQCVPSVRVRAYIYINKYIGAGACERGREKRGVWVCFPTAPWPPARLHFKQTAQAPPKVHRAAYIHRPRAFSRDRFHKDLSRRRFSATAFETVYNKSLCATAVLPNNPSVWC